MPLVKVPGIGDVQFPDDMHHDDIVRAIESDIIPQYKQMIEPGGLREAGIGGVKRNISSLATAGQGMFDATEAGKAGLARQKAITERSAFSPEKIKYLADTEGYLSAAKEAAKEVPGVITEQLPNLGEMWAGAKTGSMLGARLPLPPQGRAAAAVLGGIAGGVLPSYFSQAGTNIERQAQTAEEQGKPLDVNAQAAYTTAIPQAALDYVTDRFAFGRLLGIKPKLVGTAAAEMIAQRGLTRTLAGGAGKTIASEVPTEVTQQMLERYQAGLPLANEDALEEYRKTAYQTAMMGPLGSVNNIAERSIARGQVEQAQQARDLELAAIAQERGRIANIAATAQASEQARLRAEEQALAAREAELRKPLTQQMELDLAPETTVEEVAAKRMAESPQGDLFTGMPEAPAEVLPTLDEPTIKSFGFKKNSLPFKAMQSLTDPNMSLDEQVKRFDTIIENNQEKIKTEEQAQAVDAFKKHLADQKAKELQNATTRPELGQEPDRTSVPALDERTGAPAAEGTTEDLFGAVGPTGVDAGQLAGRAEPSAAPLVEPQAPQAQEVIRPTAEERQQRLIEQRAEEEAARRAEKEANLAEAKAEQASVIPSPIQEMTQAEREGLQAAKEAELTEPDVDMSQRMEQGAGTSVDAVHNALQDWAITPEESAPAMEVVPSVADLPADVKNIVGREARNRGITPGAIQAFTHKGKAYLIADRIKPGTERSVFMHEVGVHRGMSKGDINTVVNKINNWARAAESSLERNVYDAVQRRMEAAKELSNEETVAYAVEEAANAGVTPTAALRAKNIPANGVVAMVKQLAQRFMDVARSVFNKPAAVPTVQDLVDFVYGSAKKTMAEGPAKVEETPRLSATSTEPTGDNIFRDLVTPRVRDARLNLGAAVKAITPKLLSMYQLVDQFGLEMPALRNYAELNDKMTMTQQRLKNKSHALLSEWGEFSFKNPAMYKKLGKLMVDATRARIHPDEDITSADNSHVTEDMKDTYEELSNTYNSLSPEAKQIYQRAKNLLQENYQLRRTIYNDMVRGAYEDELAEATPEEAKAINNRIEKSIQEHELMLNEIRGPYFPLMRFGEYLVIAESDELRELRDRLPDADKAERNKIIGLMRQMEQEDRHYQVHAFEKRSDQAREAQRLKNQGLSVRESKSEEYMNSLRASSFASIDQLEKIFDREIDLDIDPAEMRKLRQAMIDSVLAGLPENSALQRQIKRRNIAGASENMLQSFAETMDRDSFYLSRMGYMKPLARSLIGMRDQSKNNMQLRDVYNNVRARLNMDVKYDNHPILSKITGFSSIYHLGIAPSYLLTNMTQPFAITLPQLAGRYGAGKASKAIISAWSDAAKAVKGGRNGKFFSMKDTDLSKVFSGGELKMVEMLQDLGKLDIANNMDTEVYTKGMSPKMIKFWNMFNWSSHNIELMNRLTTALAAYRLEMGKPGNSEVAALKAARDAVELTQLDYSDTNAAYFMKQGHMGGMNRIPMQFRKYQQGMIYLLARNFKQAWGGDKEAKAAFLYLMGTQLLMAGVRGVPVVAPLMFLMGAFGDPDDKEGDLETQLRNALADTFGADTARVFWKGLPAMMGIDSGSMSMENLFAPFPMMRASDITSAATGKDAVSEFMFNLGGAPVSMASKVMDSFILASEGDYQKALEKSLPKFIASLSRAERLGSEGLTTRSGNVAIEADEFSAWDQAIKALGFSPSKESEYYNAMYQKEKISTAIDDRRNKLIKQLATARMNGEDIADALEQVKEFNADHPVRRITGQSITRSMAQRRKDKQQRSASGVRYEKRERDIKDVTRYAD